LEMVATAWRVSYKKGKRQKCRIHRDKGLIGNSESVSRGRGRRGRGRHQETGAKNGLGKGIQRVFHRNEGVAK